MNELSLKSKAILYSIICIPLLIIVLVYYYYFQAPVDYSWFLNQTVINIWFYIIFLIFIPIPAFGFLLSKAGVLEKSIVFFIFLLLVFDMVQYAYWGLDSDQLFITLILSAFLIFSLDLMDFSIDSNTNSPKVPLNNKLVIFNIILLVITTICLIMSDGMRNFYYIFLISDYVLIILLISIILYKYRFKGWKIRKKLEES